MRPFQAFRFWARRAPTSERTSAAIATLVVVGLLAWLLVPAGDDDAPTFDVAATSDTLGTVAGVPSNSVFDPAPAGEGPGGDGSEVAQGGVEATGPAGGAAGTRTGTAGSGGPAASVRPGAQVAGSASATPGCVSPPGSAKGVSGKEVKIAVALTEIAGPAANSLFGVPTPDEARADFEAVIAGINGEGGVACRKLVARYINVNPVDESQMMQVCREIDDGDLFAVVDTGALATRPAVLACFGQRKIPYFGGFYITNTARQRFYPYIYSFYYKEQLYKNTVFALRNAGFFDAAKGFKKLGFIYRDCEREAITAFRNWLDQVVPKDLLVPYSVGCPAVFANPSDLQQAVLTFQREGVTHVTAGNFQGDLARFTNTAEQQGFRPKYGLPDEAIISIASGSQAPNPDNIANALAITLGRGGENQTPGMSPTAGTQRCNAYYQAANQPSVYEQPANAGHACDQLWMLQGALGNAPNLSRDALPTGLQRTKSIDFSYPQGPNDFTGERVTTGGQFWRVAQFMPSCRCWQVVQPDFGRGF